MVQVSSKEEVREHVTCSMCKHIFTSPQELACFHVFCERCLKTLPRVESESKQGFHCPTCNTFCVLGEEKTPYMRNEFVKAFTFGKEKCGLCGKDDAMWDCQECDYIMCDDCKMHHSKMLLNKSHSIVSCEKAEGQRLVMNQLIACEVHADKYVEYYCNICQELICSHCLVEEHAHEPNDVRKLVDAAESFIPVIRQKIDLIEEKNKIHEDQVSSSESQMNEVREVFDRVKDELGQMRQIVLQKINAQYDRDVKLLEECKNMEILKLTEFKEKHQFNNAENNHLVSFTKVTLQSAKSGSLVKELSQGLSRRIDDAVSKKTMDISEKAKLPIFSRNTFVMTNENILGKIQCDLLDETKVNKMEKHKPEGKNNISWLTITGILTAIIAVSVFYILQTKQEAHINSDFRYVDQSISDILNRLSPAATDIYTLPSGAHRMALINDSIWIPIIFTHSIAVITLNGTEVNRINFPGYGHLYPRSVLQVNTSEVLLASNKGLFVVDSTGKIQYTVAEGHFHDISKHEDTVIALQWVSNQEIKIHNLKYDSSNWINDQGTITIIKIAVGSSHVTMTVYGEIVYICSWGYHKIYKYTLGGVLLQTYGGRGSAVGELAYPRLSAVDPSGTVLVCDFNNYRLQTLSAQGEWREYMLEGGARWPRDAFILDKSLYVLCNDFENSKYKISQYNTGRWAGYVLGII